MPHPSDYVTVQHEVARLIDEGKNISTEEFEGAATEERAIALLDEKFGDIVDLRLLTDDEDKFLEMERELSAAVGGNPPREYGISTSGLAAYVVHLTELTEHTGYD